MATAMASTCRRSGQAAEEDVAAEEEVAVEVAVADCHHHASVAAVAAVGRAGKAVADVEVRPSLSASSMTKHSLLAPLPSLRGS